MYIHVCIFIKPWWKSSLTSSFGKESHDECNAASQTHKTPGGYKESDTNSNICNNQQIIRVAKLINHVLNAVTSKYYFTKLATTSIAFIVVNGPCSGWSVVPSNYARLAWLQCGLFVVVWHPVLEMWWWFPASVFKQDLFYP